MLLLKQPWTRQPQSRLLLDSRFAASALGVWVPGLGELTGKRAPSNADINSFSEIGRVYRQTGGSLDRRVFDSSDSWIPTTQFTICVVYKYGSALGTGEGVGNGYFSNVNGRATLYFGTSGSIFFDFGGATNGTTRVTGSFSYAAGKVAQIVATVGPAGMRLYVNGQLLGSNTATPTRTVATNYGFVAGDCYGGTSGNGAQQSIVAAFGSQLPDEVARSLSANPWQIFAPQRIWVPVSVAAGGGTSIDVPAASLTLTGYAPTVTATANQSIAVPAGTLSLSALAPDVLVSQRIDVPLGTLTLTGYAPVVTATANQTIAVPAGSLTLTGLAPAAIVGTRIDIPAATLTLTALTPTVSYTTNTEISVPAGSLTLTGYAPTVTGAQVSYRSGAVFYLPVRAVSGLWSTSGVEGPGGQIAWLPPARQALVYFDSRTQAYYCDPAWYRFFEYVAETKLGGVTAPTVPSLVTSVETTQSTSATASAAVTAVAQQTQTNAEALAAVRTVVQSNALDGSDQIPTVALSAATP